jgi:predicted esterase
MKPHHLSVRRTARYFLLAPPVAEDSPVGQGSDPGIGTDGGPGSVRSIWFVLHGYRQTADRFLRRFAGLRAPARLIVAPEGLSRFYLDDDGGAHGPQHRVGASWMTREDRLAEISDYVDYLDRLRAHLVEAHDAEDARTVVLGFSQGAHTATRWTLRGDRRPDSLVLWGAGPPRDLDEERDGKRLAELDVSIVWGRADPLAPERLLRAESERLGNLGVAYRLFEHDGGHDIDEQTLRELATALDPGQG